MQKKAILLISSIIFLSSLSGCIHTGTVQFDTPERPPLPVATWQSTPDGRFCTDEAGARAILKREALRDIYEDKLKATIDGCNKALK